jgi:hypothetical protein
MIYEIYNYIYMTSIVTYNVMIGNVYIYISDNSLIIRTLILQLSIYVMYMSISYSCIRAL